MGELASTVAHEVRNPLNAIAMSAQRLRREFLPAVAPAGRGPAAGPGPLRGADDQDEMEQLLGVVEGETRRINDIVQQFLEFARPPRLALAPASLGSAVRAVADAARAAALARGVNLELDAAGAGEAVFDAAQLRQALDNLVRNAIEATPSGGKVTILARTGAKGHAIEVTDTGSGIPAEDLPRIFDLYFTTKADGTGIGLAVTQQIISAHGGTIEVDSKPGAGTRMTVRLPADVQG
jgi:signal transduction histidine kinase